MNLKRGSLYFAKNSKDAGTRIPAIQMITDVSVLLDIERMRDTEYGHTGYIERQEIVKRRRMLAESINDQATLYNIIKNDTDEIVRVTAVKCIIDQSVLSDVAKNDKAGTLMREAAIMNITDQSILADVVKSIMNEANIQVMEAAMRKLVDQSALADVVKNCKSARLRGNSVL